MSRTIELLERARATGTKELVDRVELARNAIAYFGAQKEHIYLSGGQAGWRHSEYGQRCRQLLSREIVEWTETSPANTVYRAVPADLVQKRQAMEDTASFEGCPCPFSNDSRTWDLFPY